MWIVEMKQTCLPCTSQSTPRRSRCGGHCKESQLSREPRGSTTITAQQQRRDDAADTRGCGGMSDSEGRARLPGPGSRMQGAESAAPSKSFCLEKRKRRLVHCCLSRTFLSSRLEPTSCWGVQWGYGIGGNGGTGSGGIRW